MSSPIYVETGGGRRQVRAGDFPLALGGPQADVPLNGTAGAEAAAHLGFSEGEIFVQPTGGLEPVLCNGAPLTTSRWLHDGDVIRIGRTQITVELKADHTHFRAEQTAEENITEPPQIVATAAASPPAKRGPDKGIEPVAFEPRPIATAARARRRVRPAAAAVWVLLAALGGHRRRSGAGRSATRAG